MTVTPKTMHPAIAYARQIAYSSEQVLQFTFDQSVKYRDIPDVCYVEAGCAAGAQVIAMKAGAPFKVVYAFDSWAGIPLPSNKDDQMPGIQMLTKAQQMSLPDPGKQVLESSGAVNVPIESFWEHLRNSKVNRVNIIPVKGWFEETVPKWAKENADKEIAILRLDGDLYNSTLVCLQHLYPLVMKGGIVIIDDWALEGVRLAFRDYFPYEWRLHADLNVIESGDSQVLHWTK